MEWCNQEKIVMWKGLPNGGQDLLADAGKTLSTYVVTVAVRSRT
jgi:hypothetical protein